MTDIVPAAAGGGTSLEVAITGWLHATGGRSNSGRTARADRDTLASFRAAAQAAGLDLDGDADALALLAQAWAGTGDPAPATFNQRLAVLSSFYTYATRTRLLRGGNPIAQVERRKVEAYAAAQPLEPSFVADRMAKIDRTTLAGARDYALLTLGLLTGRRVREIANLEWQDVAIRSDRITLTWRRMKGGKSRRETLDAATSNILARWLERYYGARLGSLPPETPLWVSLARNGTAGHALSAQALADICEKHLGTSQFHALRHTTACRSRSAECGSAPKPISGVTRDSAFRVHTSARRRAD
jgi:integrase